jgi:hypothetical protein
MKKIVLIAGLSILLLTAMAAPAMAQWDIGIQVGDWFVYETELVQWDTEGVSFPPWWNPGLLTLNETASVNYTVTGIDANFINFTVFRQWTNGSDVTTTLDFNITNVGQDVESYLVIGANLTQGDEIRPTSQYYGPMTLNASKMRTYNNSITREANVLNYTGFGIDTEYDWDTTTGIEVYYYTGGIDVSDGTSTVTYWARMELVDSNIDELDIVPDLTGIILLLTLMTITVPVALLHRRKKPTII